MCDTLDLMDTLIQADIFFFVTTVVTIVIGVLIAVGLTYLVFVLRDLKHISHTVRTGADILADDISGLSQDIRRNGVKVKSLVDFTKKVYKRTTKAKKK